MTQPSLLGGLDLFGTDLTYPISTALLSDCGTYRYRLGRQWRMNGRRLAWVMLNPSTADDELDDPTIRRCMGFSRDLGYGGMVVVNLFALRATDPRGLSEHVEPIGPDNDRHIRSVAEECRAVVCAWGAHRMVSDGRAAEVLHMMLEVGATPHCLGRTKTGRPKHPLYVKAGTPLVEYEVSRLNGRELAAPAGHSRVVATPEPRYCACGERLLLVRPDRDTCERCRLGATTATVWRPSGIAATKDVGESDPALDATDQVEPESVVIAAAQHEPAPPLPSHDEVADFVWRHVAHLYDR